jgi:hypothetical protein
MRPQDKAVFSNAARSLGLWILVRRTNPTSLKYIGRHGFVPKPIDCKAKTSNCGELAGLVVSPELCPQAFGPQKLSNAKTAWTAFCRDQRPGQPGSRYAIQTDKKSDHYGAVTLHGSYLHGDYDLYDIIDPAQAHRNLASVETLLGQPHMRGPNLYKVMDAINHQIGVAMVQHGGEAQYSDHSEQAIDAFGPEGEECTILNKYSVVGWYKQRFGGRPNLKTS